MTALILYFTLALGVSFVCSLLEAVTLSLSYSYIATLEVKRPRSGVLLKQIQDRINYTLSAILTLNTIANTIGAMGVGAQVVKLWGNTYLAVASGVFTLMILVFSEIVPKTLGAVYWRKLAPGAAYWITGLTWLLKYPISILEIISNLVVGKGQRIRFCREEMMASVRIGHKEGALRDSESRIIRNMLKLKSIRIKDILTPRSVMLTFPGHNSIADVVKKHSPLRFSRIPVHGRDEDDIIGVVHRYRLLQALSDGKGSQEVQSIASAIHGVPETKNVASALDAFIKRKEHIFLVVDEYGGTAGILTLEDAIETLLGVEITDEFSGHETIALELACGCYFAKPYHSWERGLNENTNGLVRQYLPKKVPFPFISRSLLVLIMDRLNTRPRKLLDYTTPSKVYFKSTRLVA